MPDKNPPTEGHVVPIGPLACGQRWSLARKREDDLERSSFSGEGHRKIWARLKASSVRVSRKRVLRFMCELLEVVGTTTVSCSTLNTLILQTDALLTPVK
jgi:HTH-like domain